jgi:hypothetical protein
MIKFDVVKSNFRIFRLFYILSLFYLPSCEYCELKEKIHGSKTVDEVQEFDPLAVSINEIEDNLGYSYRKEISEEYSDNWKTVCGSFIHVELLTNAMLWDLTSGGLSKYGHLADGSMDLILCDHVPRKEFYRFVKRHTKKKNQVIMKSFSIYENYNF